MVQQLYERATETMMTSYPVRDLPLNIRPGIIFATAAWLILLGILGMAPLPALPINDKALHFFGLGFATFLIYFVVDVPETPARRVWYIRRAPLLLTLVTAFFFGGVVSEIIQSTLPWKEFEFGDIVANLCGSLIFLYLAHLLHARSRKRQELSSLYQPLSLTGQSTYRDAQGREHTFDPSGPSSRRGAEREAAGPDTGRNGGPYGNASQKQGSNVWDEESGRGSTESPPIPSGPVFGLGDDDEEDERPRDRTDAALV